MSFTQTRRGALLGLVAATAIFTALPALADDVTLKPRLLPLTIATMISPVLGSAGGFSCMSLPTFSRADAPHTNVSRGFARCLGERELFFERGHDVTEPDGNRCSTWKRRCAAT